MRTDNYEKVSLYLLGAFGNVVKYNVRTVSVVHNYDGTVFLSYIPKGKRKVRDKNLRRGGFFLIIEGDGPTPDSMFSDAQVDENGTSFQSSRYASFDPKYLSDFLEQVEKGRAKILAGRIVESRKGG